MTVRLEFTRSGGFAGHAMTVKVAADALSDEQRRVADALLAGEVDCQAQASPPRLGADRFEYRVRVRHGNRSRTYRWTDGAVPAAAEALVAELTTLARPTEAAPSP